MAGESDDDESRTEDPTPKRIEELRRDGVVPKSADVGAAAALLIGGAVLYWTSARTLEVLFGLTRHACMLRSSGDPLIALRVGGTALTGTLLPITLVTALGAVVVGLTQTFGFVDFSQAAPKLERLDPSKGITRVLPSADTLLELGKTLLKALVIAAVAWRRIDEAMPELLLLSNRPPEAAALEVGRLSVEVLIEGTIVFAILAAIDWGLAYRSWLKRARMTKQEVKDEHKQEDGDPKVKAKRKAQAAKLARERAIEATKDATVVVANPTHVSVALRYEPGRDAAPIILAKGLDDVALKMREIARAHRVPVVENRPLARALHAQGKVGAVIPVAHFEAAARVIAHVLRVRGARPIPVGGPR